MKKMIAVLVLLISTSVLAEGGGDRTYERMKHQEQQSHTTQAE